MTYPNIEAERARMGITKDELAARLNIDRRTLQNWQAGKTQLSITKLLEMAEMFKCSTDYLLGLNPQPHDRAG